MWTGSCQGKQLSSFQVSSQDGIILMSSPWYRVRPLPFRGQRFVLVVASALTGCRKQWRSFIAFIYSHNCELTLFLSRTVQLPLLDYCSTSSFLVAHSFIYSFTIHFSSTFNVTNIILGAGHTKINNACALLKAAHRFSRRVENVMAS